MLSTRWEEAVRFLSNQEIEYKLKSDWHKSKLMAHPSSQTEHNQL